MDHPGVVFYLFWLINPVTVLFHELGHAIPLLFKTKGEVQIFLGSHGDTQKSMHFKLGRLHIWFKYNPISWDCGLCVPNHEPLSLNDQILYTLSGPCFSLLIAIPTFLLVFFSDYSGIVQYVVITFLISSVLDLVRNLTPNPQQIILSNGTVTYNDGMSLKRLIKFKKLVKDWDLAFQHYNNKEYDKASAYFLECIEMDYTNDYVYEYAMASLIYSWQYGQAIDLYEKYNEKIQPSVHIHCNLGLAYGYQGDNQKSIDHFMKAIALDPDNGLICNNLGYVLNLFERYEEAIPYFDKAIQLSDEYAYSYNNRGLAKIKLGQVHEGLADINHSLELDPDNSYGYRNLGIYYLDRGEPQKAYELFQKSKQLDPRTHLIDSYLEKVNQ